MNEARLEKLKKILNERRQNLEQGSEGNSDAQNFDALNFDTSKSVSSNLNASNFDASDLNNINSKALNSNDKNSDDLNLNAECDRKFQNLYSSGATLFKNSKTRDYDKYPIVIRDRKFLFILISLFIMLLLAIIYNIEFNHKRTITMVISFYGIYIFSYSLPEYKKKGKFRNIKFYRNRIDLEINFKNQIFINLDNNTRVVRYAYGFSLLDIQMMDIKQKIIALILFIFYAVSIIYLKLYILAYVAFFLIFIQSYCIKFIYYLAKGKFRFIFHDKFTIIDSNNSINFEVNDKNELEELRIYFSNIPNIYIEKKIFFSNSKERIENE